MNLDDSSDNWKGDVREKYLVGRVGIKVRVGCEQFSGVRRGVNAHMGIRSYVVLWNAIFKLIGLYIHEEAVVAVDAW